MKKMFVTGMNMNKPKAYIEPNMKVIEVDVECLNSTSGSTVEGGDIDLDDDDYGVKQDKDWFDGNSSSLWGSLW